MFGRFTKGGYQVLRSAIAASLVAALAPCVGHAQEKPDESSAELSRRVTELSALVQKLEARVDELEGKPRASSPPVASTSNTAAPAQSVAPQDLPAPSAPSSASTYGQTLRESDCRFARRSISPRASKIVMP